MRKGSPRVSSTPRLPFALVAAVMVFGTFPAAADFASGMKAYLNGDYGVARREWLAAADAGDHDAEFWLGMSDLNGWGAPADPAKAARNFRFAAEAGNPDAQFNLAILLRDALGGSPAEIDDWLKKAATGGSAEAQAGLAERAATNVAPKIEPRAETEVVVAPPPPPAPKVEPRTETEIVAAPPPPAPKVEPRTETEIVAAPPPPPAPKVEPRTETEIVAAPPPAPKIEPRVETKVVVAPPPAPKIEPRAETKVVVAPPPAPKIEPRVETKVAAAPPPAPKVEPRVETKVAAASSEEVETLYKRGMAARSGLDEPQDLAKAADLLSLAAERGHIKAPYGLGAIYAVGGTGVLRDPIKAMMWMLVSQRKGNPDAAKGVDMLRPRLDPKQMEAATAQAGIWLSRHP